MIYSRYSTDLQKEKSVQRFQDNLEALADTLANKEETPDLEIRILFALWWEASLSVLEKLARNTKPISNGIWQAKWV
jgi:hypothetical protein